MINFGGYSLSSDDMNIILHERRICSHGKNKGKEIHPIIGYFSTIKNALEFLIEHHIKKSELKDIIAVDEKINELKSMLKLLPDLLRQT